MLQPRKDEVQTKAVTVTKKDEYEKFLYAELTKCGVLGESHYK